MTKERPTLKLGKSAAFVKTHLKRLEKDNDTWEADFRALPKPEGEAETRYLGLVVALPQGTPLVTRLVEYNPNVNDLADLLADAMRRPMTDSPRRPAQIVLRDNPRWEELFPHLKQIGIEVSIQPELTHIEEVYADFLRQMRPAQPGPLIFYTPRPTDVQEDFPNVALWVQFYGQIEVGCQKGHTFVVRATDDGGRVFEDDHSRTLAEALAALETGLAQWFTDRSIREI